MQINITTSPKLGRKAEVGDRARSWFPLAGPTERVRTRVSLRMARQGTNRGPLAQERSPQKMDRKPGKEAT